MKQPIRRKPVQISTSSTGALIALCNDGSIWAFNPESNTWVEAPQVPTGVDGDLEGFEFKEVGDES